MPVVVRAAQTVNSEERMTESSIGHAVEGGVMTITLNRPDVLNAFNMAMGVQLQSVLDLAGGNRAVRAVLITGAGRAFCAGQDLGSVSLADPAALPDLGNVVRALWNPIVRRIRQLEKPVIAAVNGVAAGGGFVLAMMCDLRFAATNGGSFTTAFSKRGLIAEHGTSWLLPRLVGTNRALDLLWSARRIDAAEAFRIGFVDQLVADEQLLDESCAYISDLAANVSPRSMARMKALVYRGWSAPIDVALREVDAEMNDALTHPDAAEGVASFVERRPPAFLPWTGGMQ